jgi:hypothetical protein
VVADEQHGRTPKDTAVGPPDGRTVGGTSPWVTEGRRLGLRDGLE